MVVTEEGMVISSRALQPEKALSPIEAKPSGRETVFKLSMPLKMLEGRFVTPSGTSIAVRRGQPLKILEPVFSIHKGILTFFKLVQLRKAS